jgi:hypothetical protein
MRYLRFLALLSVCLFATSYAHAQRVVVGVGAGPVYGYAGPAPVCAYGYYGYYPYSCAPYGYYGPDWFAGGVFIGAGPWFHGYYGPRGYGFYRHGFYGRGYGYGHGGYGYYNHGGYGRGFGGERFHDGHEHGFGGGGFHGGYGHEGFHGGGRR